MAVSCEKNEKHILAVKPVVVVLSHGEQRLPGERDIGVKDANKAEYIEGEKLTMCFPCLENTFSLAIPMM